MHTTGSGCISSSLSLLYSVISYLIFKKIQGISGQSKKILERLEILTEVLDVCDQIIIDQTKMIVIDWAYIDRM